MLVMITRFVMQQQNGHTETVKLLLDRGANIHAANDLALRLAA